MKTLGSIIRSARQDACMTQGDIETRAGFLRCYLSRLENDHTEPTIHTLIELGKTTGTRAWRIIKEFEEQEP